MPISMTALAAVAFFTVPLSAQTPPSASPKPLGSTYYPWDTLATTPTASGIRRDVIDSPTLAFARLAMHITTLNPGAASHPPAHHAQEEVIWVKEGTLDLWLNGKAQKAGQGAFIFLAANAHHTITNAGDKPATYYVIDVYTAATATVKEGPADEWAPVGKLRSTVFDCNSITEIPRPTGSRRPVVDSPTATFVRLESHITKLNGGATTGSLNDEADEIIIITSGLIESTIKGVTCRLGPGSFYFQRANDIHSSTNAGSTPASYQVIKFVSEVVPKPVP